MHKISTVAIAAALGLAWTALPAGAQDTTRDKADRAGDKVERQAERAADKTEHAADRAEDKLDRAADKAEDKGETVGEKLDRAVDKTKAEGRELKNKASAAMDRADAKNAQQALKEKGYDPGPIDGVHGPRTSAAVREFQKAEGLPVTGQVDGETRERLMAGSSVSSPAASPSTMSPASPSSVGSPSQAPAVPPQR